MRQALAETNGPSNADAKFAKMLSSEAGRLAGYARRLAGNAADADDLFQETMLRCWAARRSFRHDTNFVGWTRAVMRNSFFTERRRARFRADLPDAAIERMLNVAPNQSEGVELHDVDRAMTELTPDHRAAVLLASQGFSVEEAAASLSIHPNTFKSRVWRARARLKSLIEDRDTSLGSTPPTKAGPASKPSKRRDWKGVMIG